MISADIMATIGTTFVTAQARLLSKQLSQHAMPTKAFLVGAFSFFELRERCCGEVGGRVGCAPLSPAAHVRLAHAGSVAGPIIAVLTAAGASVRLSDVCKTRRRRRKVQKKRERGRGLGAGLPLE